MLPKVTLASYHGEVGHEYGSVVMTLPSLGIERNTITTGPRRRIHIRANLFVTALRSAVRLLPKHDLARARGEAARHMHVRALNAVEVRAPSACL